MVGPIYNSVPNSGNIYGLLNITGMANGLLSCFTDKVLFLSTSEICLMVKWHNDAESENGISNDKNQI